MIEKSLYKLREKTIDATDFVGVELHERGFNQQKLTKEQVESIRNIIVVK